MIDFSESLLEGAEFLSGKYGKGKGGEAGMLSEVENLLFLLERVNKYYIAHKAGFTDYNNVVQLQKAVEDFEGGLKKINSYSRYPETVQNSVKKINQFWPLAKEFYLGVQKNALPVIVLASTDRLEKEVKTLADFHHQDQVDAEPDGVESGRRDHGQGDGQGHHHDGEAVQQASQHHVDQADQAQDQKDHQEFQEA